MNWKQSLRALGMAALLASVLLSAACNVQIESASERQMNQIAAATMTASKPPAEPPASDSTPTAVPTPGPLALYPTPTPRAGQPTSKPTAISTGAVNTRAATTPASPANPSAAIKHVASKSAPTRIVSQAIKLDAPIKETTWEIVNQGGLSFSQWIVPDYVAGWHSNSALPGAIGNTVLSGHHNIRGEVFRHLVDLLVGDPIYLYADGRWFPYRVDLTFIVPERDASAEEQQQNALWIAPTTDERMTLVTCWPYTTNTHRLIVVARPADDLAGVAPQ